MRCDRLCIHMQPKVELVPLQTLLTLWGMDMREVACVGEEAFKRGLDWCCLKSPMEVKCCLNPRLSHFFRSWQAGASGLRWWLGAIPAADLSVHNFKSSSSWAPFTSPHITIAYEATPQNICASHDASNTHSLLAYHTVPTPSRRILRNSPV